MTWQELEELITEHLSDDLQHVCKRPDLRERMWKEWHKWCDEHIAASVRLAAKHHMGMHQRYGSVSPFTNLLAVLNGEESE